MKTENWILLGVVLLMLAVIGADIYYVSKFQVQFNVLEKQRIITTNKLATAKIVHENLNHVRELVFANMDFPGQVDSVSHETYLFEFLTTCINDLKLKLVSVKPVRPIVKGRITTYGYDLELEGDFFKIGELCAKFENSRRIIAVESFDISLLSTGDVPIRGENKGIKVKMRLNTYRIEKLTVTENSETIEKKS